LGFAAGEAILPLIAVSLIAVFGWRETWMLIGLVMAGVFIPLLLWLLRGHGERHRAHLESLRTETGDGSAPAERTWTRSDVLHDPRFYLLAFILMAAPFILTGLFFHQVHLANFKNWNLEWLAACFVGFAVAKIITSLLTGPLIDRIGATRLLPTFLLPLGAALAVLGLFDHPAVALVYMIGGGVTTGASVTIGGALWAEIYGVANLGAIKALTSALMVFATALSPVSVGWLIDSGTSMNTISLLGFAYVAAAVLVSLTLTRRLRA
ncbi:MAG: hypothetical protein OEY85_02945, partial [Rhodospirillales bacterium]|nr:hypothetical protein [Rhodospirillales bacterium]